MHAAKLSISTTGDSIVFLLHDAVPKHVNGGLMATINTALAIKKYLRIDVKIACLRGTVNVIVDAFEDMDSSLFIEYEDFSDDFLPRVQAFNVVVATYFPTVWMAKMIRRAAEDTAVIYFVQDYESLFANLEKPYREAAKLSYTAEPDMLLVAYSDWVIKTLESKHGIEVQKVSCHPFSAKTIMAQSTKRNNRDSSRIKIMSMVRPSTPRRNPDRHFLHCSN